MHVLGMQSMFLAPFMSCSSWSVIHLIFHRGQRKNAHHDHSERPSKLCEAFLRGYLSVVHPSLAFCQDGGGGSRPNGLEYKSVMRFSTWYNSKIEGFEI